MKRIDSMTPDEYDNYSDSIYMEKERKKELKQKIYDMSN
jgi:hypothetical protein